jgi:DNA-binding MarR family transcriptional regulator
MPISKSPARADAKRQARSLKDKSGNAAGSQRVKRRRSEYAAIEKKEPLRRRILASLAKAPASPKVLAGQLEAAVPSVSRVLGEFRDQGLVVAEGDEGDRRRVTYSLSEAGEVALNRHLSFGARQRPKAKVDNGQQLRLQRSALDRAVRIRREANRLGEAADRLRAVIREAEKLGANEIALEAMAELAKTVRQNRAPEDQGELGASLEEVIDRLNAIALGNDSAYGAEFAVPAAAHLKYTLGRAGERRGDDLAAREAHLTAACSLYGQLVKNSEAPAQSEWFGRQAWSVISLAGNLRKQTRLEKALRFATMAKRCFDINDDEYGRAQCFFMFGFCLRLLGEFREASVCLERAFKIADENSFQRARADTLMQMGEVQRCLGAFAGARNLLNEAVEQAERMQLFVTHAFAQSALGAVEFQQDEFGVAREYLGRAQQLFESCSHIEGQALNARRLAAASRRIAGASANPNYAAVERLIDSAYQDYERLQSPAGMAACAIEEGRIRMLRKRGRVTPVIDRLNAMLASPTQCVILELDPWVPQLLSRFANDVDDEDLVSESGRVLMQAQKILAERGAQSVERIAEVMDIKPEEEGEIELPAAEMGGEARRDPSAFEELTLVDEHGPELRAAA